MSSAGRIRSPPLGGRGSSHFGDFDLVGVIDDAPKPTSSDFALGSFLYTRECRASCSNAICKSRGALSL